MALKETSFCRSATTKTGISRLKLTTKTNRRHPSRAVTWMGWTKVIFHNLKKKTLHFCQLWFFKSTQKSKFPPQSHQGPQQLSSFKYQSTVACAVMQLALSKLVDNSKFQAPTFSPQTTNNVPMFPFYERLSNISWISERAHDPHRISMFISSGVVKIAEFFRTHFVWSHGYKPSKVATDFHCDSFAISIVIFSHTKFASPRLDLPAIMREKI